MGKKKLTNNNVKITGLTTVKPRESSEIEMRVEKEESAVNYMISEQEKLEKDELIQNNVNF